MPFETIEYHPTRVQVLPFLGFFLLLGGLTAWVILGGITISGPKAWMLRVLAPPFYLALVGYYLYQFIARPAALVLEENGVRQRRWFRETIVPWACIADVVAHRCKDALMLEIKTSGDPIPAEVERSVQGRAEWWVRLLMPGTSMRVSTFFVKLPLEDALARIEKRLAGRLAPRIVTYRNAREFQDALFSLRRAA